MSKKSRFPPGWDEERVQRVINHYESQPEKEAVAEDEAALASFGMSDAPQLTNEERAELDRRVREYEDNPDAGSPWSEVKERILKKR